MKDGMKGMIDNRRVKDTHQEGIERVKQRKGEHEKVDGHNGYMGGKVGSESNWKRKGDTLTPRKA